MNHFTTCSSIFRNIDSSRKEDYKDNAICVICKKSLFLVKTGLAISPTDIQGHTYVWVCNEACANMYILSKL
jgi:hypothetical protein